MNQNIPELVQVTKTIDKLAEEHGDYIVLGHIAFLAARIAHRSEVTKDLFQEIFLYALKCVEAAHKVTGMKDMN